LISAAVRLARRGELFVFRDRTLYMYVAQPVREGVFLTSSDKNGFIAAIEKAHGQRLRRFLALKLRHRVADVPDIVQEVFLRLLRIQHHETIRSPESYLFTIAFHVLQQHAMRLSAVPESVEITALVDQMELASDTDPLQQAETQQRLDELQSVISQLPPKAQAVLLLHVRDGYSLDEIASQLGFSRSSAAKYLAKSLLHCRQDLERRTRKEPAR
jgi:RNA polymerase sigma factor (sigma-70 family)